MFTAGVKIRKLKLSPALGRRRKENEGFKVISDYIASWNKLEASLG